MRARWNSLYGRANIYSKQQKTQRVNPTRKSQISRYGTFWIAKNNEIDQAKLLMARTKGRHQKIHSRIF